MEDKLVGEVLQHVEREGLKLLNVEIANALMVGKFFASVFLVADLAHDLDVWTVPLDMLIQLHSRHMLIFLTIANVATEFRTVELCMSLKFSQGLPNDFSSSVEARAFMWEFTEVNTVLQHLVHLL